MAQSQKEEVGKIQVDRETDAWSWRVGGEIDGGPKSGVTGPEALERTEVILRLCQGICTE